MKCSEAGITMKANNISISIPNKGCRKNCSYCVSKMTGYMKTDKELFINNRHKARRLAEMSEVSSVSITGKGEPSLIYQEDGHMYTTWNSLASRIF